MYARKPEWLKLKYTETSHSEVSLLMKRYSLNTVCREANCPNMGECYKKGTATFMILGSRCTRSCPFCNVESGSPLAPDPAEPEHVAQAVEKLQLKYSVITSVTRDDLPDEGAVHFAQTIRAIKSLCPDVKVEVLIPDMHAKPELLDIVLSAKPDVLNHNMETIERLYGAVRPQAKYRRSLDVLRYAKEKYASVTKTGIMVGLGETEDEVFKLMDDVLDTGCDILTIGQYLRPTPNHIEVAEYVHPDKFKKYKETGMQKGFRYVASAPFVRSSYNAAEAFLYGSL